MKSRILGINHRLFVSIGDRQISTFVFGMLRIRVVVGELPHGVDIVCKSSRF